MKKVLLGVASFALVAGIASAQLIGIADSAVFHAEGDGGNGVWYNGSANWAASSFDGADLGEVNLGGSVTLAAEAQTWNRTFGQEVDMGWSINGGNVSWHELGYLSNVGDNNTLWQSPGFNGVNVADGLGVGEYDVAVFFRATQDGDDAVWDSNAGNNYTASFEVIPEPTTIGLIGLGLAGLLVARRRRA